MNGADPEPNDRLDSWKAIATYLRRDVRTVQLWEKAQGLPIHRQHHASLASVFAFKSELDCWRNDRTSKPKPSRPASHSLVWPVSVALSCITVLLGTLWIWRHHSPTDHHPAASGHRSPDPETHEHYLRGRHFLAMRDADGMREALRCFRLAAQRDPQYAEAYVGLADTYDLLGMYELTAPDESFPKAKDFASKALQLDDTLPEAYTARAVAASFWEFDWAGADRDFQRAIVLNPNSAETHHWYGEHLVNLGQAERALVELKRARSLDPLSLAINCTLGRVYRDTHRYHEAIEQCLNTLHLAPKFSMGHWCLAQAYVGERRYALALPELELANSLGSTPLLACDLGCVYARTGRKREAQTILRKLREKAQSGYVSPYLIAAIYGALDENNQAFAWLDRAYNQHDPHITYLALDPRLDSLRSDRRFPLLVQRLKLPK